jgi:pimeloyl-ACP methyl ester carboxylesterase
MYFELSGRHCFSGTGGKSFDKRNPVVVFLPGSGLDHTFWSLQSRFFAFRNYAVLAIDFPGHGQSDGPCLASIEAMADWLNEVVEMLGADKLSLVGHSQGCLVALEFVSRYPRRVRSVSFIASGLATPVNPALIEAAENAPEKAIEMMNSWGFGSAGHFYTGAVPGASLPGIGRRVMVRNVPAGLATDLRACNAYQNGRAAAANIAVPTQVILAGKDRMAPRKAGMELVRHLQEPEVHVIPGSGHMLPIEVPDACRRLLRDFIFAQNPAVAT